MSTAAYIGMLYTLFHRSTDGEVNVTSTMWFVTITWSLFPLVWVLAPTGSGFITTLVEAGLYEILDFITKIVFGVYISLHYKSG